MKTFFASLLGTLAAVLLLLLGTVTAGVVLITAMAAMGDKAPSLEKDSLLVLDLDADITDTPEQINDSAIFEALRGEEGPVTLQLRTVLQVLEHAAHDSQIKGLFITGSFAPSSYGSSFAALGEVRAAIERFRATGKPVRSYFVNLGTREYYLATAADEVVLDPFGGLFVPGLASQPMFLAGAFERFGIGVQVVRVGKYKSAIEPFVRRDLSPESREQLQALLDDLWTSLKSTVAVARGMAPDALQALVDSGRGFQPSEALATGLVDRLAYRDTVLDELKALTGNDEDARTFRQISVSRYAGLIGTGSPGGPELDGVDGDRSGRVAIIYAEGAIVDGEGHDGEVGGDRFAREVRRLRQDSKVKAIVLRVNSPGGSATASEHILRELQLAAETMPVVVSMGGMAASGGYWISMHSTRIFAEPMTITGSIGVFGALFNIEKLGNDLGFTWDTVKTADMADVLSIARPKTEAELAVIQASVDSVYQEFLRRVAETRGMSVEAVHEIAQGRVWSGERAVEVGLVDEVGGIDAAVAYAAREAGLSDDFSLSEFPRSKDLGEAIAEMIERLQPSGARLPGPLGAVIRQAEEHVKVMAEFNDPRMIYVRLPLELMVR